MPTECFVPLSWQALHKNHVTLQTGDRSNSGHSDTWSLSSSQTGCFIYYCNNQMLQHTVWQSVSSNAAITKCCLIFFSLSQFQSSLSLFIPGGPTSTSSSIGYTLVWKLKHLILGASFLSISSCFSPSAILCFHLLSALLKLLAHSPAFFLTPLRPAPLSEAGKCLLVWWLKLKDHIYAPANISTINSDPPPPPHLHPSPNWRTKKWRRTEFWLGTGLKSGFVVCRPLQNLRTKVRCQGLEYW